ncbi:FG-GAP repeat protein [Saccharospirillum sp. MSK14-1]|uniref:FG-GAP repeat protein n=1 Tax=Saccharospirillum sp. MSK14-1 TaxID=1897632 RepID=UPI0013049F77|nr:FG-GAP repeat protein [Saccharospirillum sp. MSK14-1]
MNSAIYLYQALRPSVTILALVALLSACSPESNTPDGPTGPPGPVLTVEPIKQFRFDWPASESGTHYRILENPDGQSGFTDVSGDIPIGTETFTIEVPLHARIRAQYILQRCDGSECADSRATTIADNLARGVGYFKPDVLVSFGYEFGQAVALSGDGKTMAVAGGDDLYIFVETAAGQWQQQDKIGLRSPASDLAFSSDGNRLAVGSRLDNSNATGIYSARSGASTGGATFSGAVYVFSRSGTNWSEQAYIKASNVTEYAYFGRSISLSADGTLLAVGANAENNDDRGISTTFPASTDVTGLADSGALYLYRYSGGQWHEDAYIKASNAHTKDWFGYSVSLSGDGQRLVVGAIQEDNDATGVSTTFPNAADTGNQWRSGAAYLYYYTGGQWTEEAYIKASNTLTEARFGASVSFNNDGDLLAVGAQDEATNMHGVHQRPSPGASHNRSGSGAAYVFARTGSTWTEAAFIKADNADNNDHFGIGVRLSSDGQWLAVVAKEESSAAAGVHRSSRNQRNNSVPGAGAVYLYRRNTTLWSEQAYVKASNNRSGDGGFGYHVQPSLDLSNDGQRLLVGSWAEDGLTTGIQSNQNDRSGDEIGAVFLY